MGSTEREPDRGMSATFRHSVQSRWKGLRNKVSRLHFLFVLAQQAYARNFDYTSVHVVGAERIAKIAANSGVSRLVHLSHLNASHKSTSKFYRTKAEGEERVRAAFPDSTIVRPASMYGHEDKLLNNIASTSMLSLCLLFLLNL